MGEPYVLELVLEVGRGSNVSINMISLNQERTCSDVSRLSCCVSMYFCFFFFFSLNIFTHINIHHGFIVSSLLQYHFTNHCHIVFTHSFLTRESGCIINFGILICPFINRHISTSNGHILIFFPSIHTLGFSRMSVLSWVWNLSRLCYVYGLMLCDYRMADDYYFLIHTYIYIMIYLQHVCSCIYAIKTPDSLKKN